jgi:hypothetical protein
MQTPGRNHLRSCSTVAAPRFNIITTNTNSTIIAPAYTIISKMPANGAPNTKKIIATANNETIKFNSACTGFKPVITRAVASSATAPAR